MLLARASIGPQRSTSVLINRDKAGEGVGARARDVVSKQQGAGREGSPAGGGPAQPSPSQTAGGCCPASRRRPQAPAAQPSRLTCIKLVALHLERVRRAAGQVVRLAHSHAVAVARQQRGAAQACGPGQEGAGGRRPIGRARRQGARRGRAWAAGRRPSRPSRCAVCAHRRCLSRSQRSRSCGSCQRSTRPRRLPCARAGPSAPPPPPPWPIGPRRRARAGAAGRPCAAALRPRRAQPRGHRPRPAARRAPSRAAAACRHCCRIAVAGLGGVEGARK
jgi:hypothetical protein